MLAVWGDQKEEIKSFNFYHFSLVKAQFDKNKKLELVINRTRSDFESNTSTRFSINQTKCRDIKE